MAALSVGVFYGCQKNLDTLDPIVSNNPTFVANPLTVDMVQTWFESNYGKSKLITPPARDFSLTNNDDSHAYLNETFSITPKWTSAKIVTYLQVLPVAIVPIEPIPFFDSKSLSYVLVCFIDSTRNINARLQVYKATEKYQNEHKSYDVKTFSGMFFQIALDGKLERIYGLTNGKFDSKLNLKKPEQGSILGANNSSLTTRSNWQGCWGCNTVPGYAETFPLRCFFCTLGFGESNEEITNDGTNSNYFYGSLGFGNPSTSLYPSATGQFDSGANGSSGSSNGDNSGSSNWGLSDEFDNSMFDINADLYAQRNRQNYVLTTLNPTGSEKVFLDANKLIYNQLYDYLVNSELSVTEKKVFASQHLTLLINVASYLSLNQQLGYLESIVQSYTKFAKAGFTAREFAMLFSDQGLFAQVDGLKGKLNQAAFNDTDFKKIYDKKALLTSLLTFLSDNRLSEAAKVKALQEYKADIDWNKVSVPDIVIERSKDRDVRLDLANLENSSYFTEFTAIDIRNTIKLDYPTLEQYQVNISAGVALENAYAYFSGYSRPGNTLVVNETSGAPLVRITRPDFEHGTLYENLNSGEKAYYPYAGKIEVKVSQNPIKLNTNKWQIAAEIAMSYAAAPEDQLINYPSKHAGHAERKAGSFTLVLPYGSTYDTEIEAECTRLNVNFYVSYAFIGQNGEVVFSNPKRINNISPEVKLGTGVLDKGAILDFEKATVYWRDNQKKDNLKNETNNALDGSE